MIFSNQFINLFSELTQSHLKNQIAFLRVENQILRNKCPYRCDFFAKTVWTPFGPKIFYCLFFINIRTRKVHIAGITTNPNKQWTLTQIEKLRPTFQEELFDKAVLIRDRDNKYSKEFDKFFEDQDIKVLPTPYRSPNMNPYAESWVATVKRECLNHFIVLGKVHLEYLITEFVKYYNNHRPHSSMNNEPLTRFEKSKHGKILARPVLGGLIHDYYIE